MLGGRDRWDFLPPVEFPVSGRDSSSVPDRYQVGEARTTTSPSVGLSIPLSVTPEIGPPSPHLSTRGMDEVVVVTRSEVE